MQALQVARLLRAGNPAAAQAQLLKCFAATDPAPLDDIAALAERFARTVPPPPWPFFGEVANHFQAVLRSGRAKVDVATTVVLADAFARVRFVDANGVLGLVCLAAPPTSALAPVDVLRLVRACAALGAQGDPGMRGAVIMRLQTSAHKMHPGSLAEVASLLAKMQMYSPDVSGAVEKQLNDNPWVFDRRDSVRLLSHFSAWQLGSVQKRAFQRLGSALSDYAEDITPQEAVDAIDCFTRVGSAHEILLQHLHLNLLIDRRFTVLEPSGIARLVASMSRVEYYHTGLLREIVVYLGENPGCPAQWEADEVSGVLRCLGLAPVHVPAPTLRLLGCRYATLLPGMDAQRLRDLFEVSARYPDLLRAILRRGGGKRLASKIETFLPAWGASACSDVVLAMALAIDASPAERTDGRCACMAGDDETAEAERDPREYRTRQPKPQMQVFYKSYRNDFGAKEEPRYLLKKWNIYMADGKGPREVAMIPSSPKALECQAPWGQLGRRSRPRAAPDLPRLLETAFLGLQSAVDAGGRELGELPESPPVSQLLALEEGGPEPLMLGGSSASSALVPQEQSSSGLTWPSSAERNELSFAPSLRDGGSRDRAGDTFSGAAGGLQRLQDAPLRRSELLEVAAQTLASLQLCFGPCTPLPLRRLPRGCFQAIERLLPVVNNMLGPRRNDDPVVARYHLGPLRMEAFVRRRDEPLAKEVRETLRDMSPFLPHLLGWAEWPLRRIDRIEGFPTGGAFVSLNKEVEVSPFVICMVLRRKGRPLQSG